MHPSIKPTFDIVFRLSCASTGYINQGYDGINIVSPGSGLDLVNRDDPLTWYITFINPKLVPETELKSGYDSRVTPHGPFTHGVIAYYSLSITALNGLARAAYMEFMPLTRWVAINRIFASNMIFKYPNDLSTRIAEYKIAGNVPT
jgi:hypothetical protein